MSLVLLPNLFVSLKSANVLKIGYAISPYVPTPILPVVRASANIDNHVGQIFVCHCTNVMSFCPFSKKM